MDRDYLSAKLAEALGNEHGVVEAEHKLLNDGALAMGMKRQLLEIHNEDEQHVRNLTKALEMIGPADNAQQSIELGKERCLRMIESGGDDPIDRLNAMILAKYRSADSEELFYELCGEMGQDDICDLFEISLEEEEDHLDYLREQSLIMTRARITGEREVI